MQDQMLEEKRTEDEESSMQEMETEDESQGLEEPDQEPRRERERRHSTWGKGIVALAVCAGIVCGALPTSWYFNTKLDKLQSQLEQEQEQEQHMVSQSTIRDLVYQYGLSTAFIQRLFPQQYVYMGKNGIAIEPYEDALPRHSYDWSGLGEANGRYTYTAADGTQALFGVDVSTFSGDIDWTAVKADGVSFAMVRVGFRGYGESGKLVLDDRYASYLQGATEAGLDVGVYFFSQAITEEEAVEEAEYVIQALKDYSITYPVVFDLENIGYDTARTDHLSVEMATKVTQAFCQRIAQEGYHPMIYGNVAWLMDSIDLTQLTEYDVWLAQYQKTPTFPYQFQMWQYSHEGTVAGIEGSVDMNLLLTPFASS